MLPQHVVRNNNEKTLEAAMKLRTETFQQIIDLGSREVGRELSDGLNEGEGLDPLVSGILCRKDLEDRSGIISKNFGTRPWIRVLVPLPIELKDSDPSQGGGGDAISDRNPLEGWRQSVLSFQKETAERFPDLFGELDGWGRHLVESLGVLALPSGVLDVAHLALSAHEDGKHSHDVTLGSLLPLFGLELWKPLQALNHEEMLVADVLLPI